MQTGLILGRNFAENHYHVAIIRHQMTRKVPEMLPEILDEVRNSFGRFMPMENSMRRCKLFLSGTKQ